MRMVAIFAIVAGLAEAACITVPSSDILARDLSTPIPLLRTLAPDTIIGFAPFPGTVRVLSSRDVVLIARRHGLAFPPGETAPSCVCRADRSPPFPRGSDDGPAFSAGCHRRAAGSPGISAISLFLQAGWIFNAQV